MEYREYISWVNYRNKHGGLNPGKRIDGGLSMIAAHFSRAFVKFADGHKVTPNDFTLYPEIAEESEGSVEDVFKLLSSVANKQE